MRGGWLGDIIMIHRAEHNDNFTRVQNQLITDSRLSFEARGFLMFVLSLPDDWTFSLNGLANLAGISRNITMRLIKELKAAGYVTQERRKDLKGKIDACEWHIYETPTVDKNHSEENPQCEKSRPIQTTNINKLLNNTKNIYGEFQNVKLSTEEFEKLGDKLGGEERDGLIFELSCYLKNHPKKYKDHYATLLNWSRRKKEAPTPIKDSKPKKFGLDYNELMKRAEERDRQKAEGGNE